MKSIIQEASTLSKAIEQGWVKAGKPSLFSIKIIQEPSKNFIGMTTQNAKIILFFGRLDTITTPQQQPQASVSVKEPQQRYQKQPYQSHHPRKTYRKYHPQHMQAKQQPQAKQQQPQEKQQQTNQPERKPQS